MKHLNIFAVLLCLLTALSPGGAAQNDSWIEISSNDEFFRVLMPRQPISEDQRIRFGEISVNGKWLESATDGASYAVWALVDTKYRSRDIDEYLDVCADLVWEGLLKPARDKLPDDGRGKAAMTYVKELPAKPLPGREYSVTIGDLTGTTQFFVAEARIYVLLAMNSPGGVWARQRFFESFTISPNLPVLHSLYGDPIGPGIRSTGSDPTDYNRVFNGGEVSQEARVLDKPDATYTESARKYGVSGTIVLRAVFSRDGEVTNIYVVRRLPHGLTQAAVKAARGIRFSPALKDAHPVSQYIELQYNFNLY
jgi:TonB family protein